MLLFSHALVCQQNSISCKFDKDYLFKRGLHCMYDPYRAHISESLKHYNRQSKNILSKTSLTVQSILNKKKISTANPIEGWTNKLNQLNRTLSYSSYKQTENSKQSWTYAMLCSVCNETNTWISVNKLYSSSVRFLRHKGPLQRLWHWHDPICKNW